MNAFRTELNIYNMRSFLLNFLALYYGATIFIVLHMMVLLKPFKFKYIVLILYILFSIAVFLGRFWGNHFPLNISAWLARIGYIWMGLLVYMLIWSLICLFLNQINIAPTSERHRLYFFILEIGLCLTILIFGYINAHNVKIVRHKIETEKDINLVIAQISDNHLGFMNSEYRFSRIVDRLISISPDILLITGDFLENEHNYAVIKEIGSSLRRLNPRLGIFGITGNHEYISGIENSIKYMENLGIQMLLDSSVIFQEVPLRIIGREDSSRSRWTTDANKTLEELLLSDDNTDNLFTILMTHQVKNHKEYENKSIDLVISGHTHFGQYFPFNIVTKRIFDIAYGSEK